MRKELRSTALAMMVGASLLVGCRQETPPTAGSPTPTEVVADSSPVAVSSATPTTPLPGDEVVAQVNGESISRARWERQVARVHSYLKEEEGVDPESLEGQQQLEQAGAYVLEEMIDEWLIRQAAARLSISIPESQLDEIIERDIEQAGGVDAFQSWLSTNQVSLEEYRAATELQLLTSALRERVTSDIPATQPQIHLRHILLPDEESATELLAELGAGADFATLAASHSIDPGTRENGGDLGWLPRGLLPTSLDEVVWELGPGERSGVIQSEFGFHVVEVIESDPARPLPLELLQTLQQQAWERWLVAERANATIERWLTP